MSYLEKVDINIRETYQAGDLSFNLLLLDTATTSDSAATAYTKQSDLSGLSDGILKKSLTAIFAEASGVSTVYYYRVKIGEEVKVKDIQTTNSIWATVVIGSSTAQNVVDNLPGKGVVLYPLSATTYTKPTYTNDRLAYYRTTTPEAIGVVASLALANQPIRTWANRLMKFKPGSNTPGELNTYKTDKVNGFYIEGTNYYAGDGFTSTGKYIDNQFSKDYLVSYLRNEIKSVLLGDPKPKYDYRGIAQIEAVLVNAFNYLGEYGIIEELAEGKYNYIYEVKPRSSQASEDIQNRKLSATAKVFFAGSIEKFGLDISITEI